MLPREYRSRGGFPTQQSFSSSLLPGDPEPRCPGPPRQVPAGLGPPGWGFWWLCLPREFRWARGSILRVFSEKIPPQLEILGMGFLITPRECPGMATFALGRCGGCSASSRFSRVLAGPWPSWQGITRVLVHHPGRNGMGRVRLQPCSSQSPHPVPSGISLPGMRGRGVPGGAENRHTANAAFSGFCCPSSFPELLFPTLECGF